MQLHLWNSVFSCVGVCVLGERCEENSIAQSLYSTAQAVVQGTMWAPLERSWACGSSQARGRIGATAAGQHHTYSNASSEPRVCDLHHSSRQHRVLDPLSKARDQTLNLMVPSQIR